MAYGRAGNVLRGTVVADDMDASQTRKKCMPRSGAAPEHLVDLCSGLCGGVDPQRSRDMVDRDDRCAVSPYLLLDGVALGFTYAAMGVN